MALSHLLDTTPPRLLTVAACGGLEPAPDSRLRGTYPHLLHSIAPPFVSAFVAHGRLLKPQPGRPQRTCINELASWWRARLAFGSFVEPPPARYRSRPDIEFSPSRPGSAMANACLFFAVSIPTNASVYCSMVRPPRMRLGSVRPSKPSYSYCTSGRAADHGTRT